MDKNKTTIKTRAADKLTDLRVAHNDLAVAIKNFNKSHSTADQKAIDKARARIAELEKAYKEGRDHKLKAVCEKQKPQRRKPWVSLLGK